MKKIITCLLSLLMCTALTGCNTNSADEEDNLTEGYDDIISQIVDCYKEDQEIDYKTLGISDVFAYKTETMGYVKKDLDDNGIDELILGETIGDNAVIYDLYSVKEDGTLVHVLNGGERDNYYLLKENILYEVASSSADESEENYYTYKDTKLSKTDAVKLEYQDLEYTTFKSLENKD